MKIRKSVFYIIWVVLLVNFTCLKDGHSSNFITKGEYEEKKGNFGNAIIYYEKALYEQPNNIYLYIKIGNIYKKILLNDNKALEIYLKGIDRFPQSFELNVYVMQLFFNIGKVDDGLKQYKFISKIRKDNDKYMFPRTIIYRFKKELSKEEFISFCKEHIDINPTDIILREVLSREYLNKGDALNAKKELEAIISYGNKSGYIYFDLALCHYNLGDNKKALDYFVKAKDLGAHVPQKYIDAVRNKL